ncbi:uncharacterized protein LOC122624862 [Drosophila teissieri]|uniref:uncharacterized protein LOC122624862 n=1 Tax=Drosophila teissieri TaxID=7243 RepID=UPI001CBA0FC4|nr:uncharacterized protein LOC122624862 [Drosophila teissieri]XP_043660539.1 uncharacterized protein LOC122624862 [Drosophila teissieri]XP_043660540.1 uncharacterized protein LOC122624862 [Drosophila teissieri]
MNKAQRQDSNHRKSLNLLDKALPISVATAPQLRSRRQFSFNGLRYEMNGLLPLPPPPPTPTSTPQVQLSRLRAGGGVGGCQERQQTAGSSHSMNAKSMVESAGGDGGATRPDRKGVWPQHVSLGDRALLMNGGLRMPRRSELGFPTTKPTAKRTCSQLSVQVEGLDRKLERRDAAEHMPDREDLRREKKHRRRPHSMELQEGRGSAPDQCDLTSQQSWMLAQTLLKAYGSGLVQTSGGNGASAKMDYITLTGLVLGCVASHVLFFLCWYFSWLKSRAIGLRKRFLGNANLWEFFDLEDTTRYSVQTKLVMAPLILICGLLYCVVNLLHLVVQVVRSDVPRTVVVFVQRVANSGLLGTITMGLAGGGGGGGGSAAIRGRHHQAMR